MPLTFLRDDIAHMRVDAIVNAANPALEEGGGVCGVIFSAAGRERMRLACRRIGGCAVGEAVATPGFGLNAKYVIHAVGPVWRGGGQGEEVLLYSAYQKALETAKTVHAQSVAFPLISSGIYGYPKADALRVAVEAIREFLQREEMLVYLLLFDREAVRAGIPLSGRIRRYINDHSVDGTPFMNAQTAETAAASIFSGGENPNTKLNAVPPVCSKPEKAGHKETEGKGLRPRWPLRKRRQAQSEPLSCGPGDAFREEASAASASPEKRRLEEVVGMLDESFSQMLLRLIDQKGLTDVEAYKGANLDRRLFSKIRGDAGYRPSKATAIALAVALKLNMDETADLMARAGYVLSPCDLGDVIVRFFIQEGNYDIFSINEALFAYDQKTLGA